MIAFDAMRWSFVPEISASFTSSNQIICAGETINYTNTCLHADSCKWILTGSDLNITNQPNPSAVYNSAGTYNVTLIAFSTYGNDTLYMPDYVTVNPLPQANFIAANTNIQLPGAIALFTNNSQNSSAYIWNFGDGALSTDQDPYHIYTSAGNFTVSLIASNGLCPSDTLIMTNYITVLNATDIFHNSSLTPVINANNGQLFILCGNTSLNNVTIKVTDEIGRNIITKEIERISTDFTFALPRNHGIFIISLSAENIESIFLKYVNY
jgi:PKD repeat protein